MKFNNYNSGFFSLFEPILKPKHWLYTAKQKIINSHKRTLLGPFWILLHLIIFTTALGSVYSGLFKVQFFSYISYLATGFMGWIWVASIISASGTIFIEHSNMIKSSPILLSNLIWSHCMHNFIIFIYQTPLILFFYTFGITEFNINFLFIIPSLIIVFIINLSVAAILSVLIPRFLDIQKLITSAIIIIMITTPILWQPGMMSGARKLIYLLNPIYYIVEIIRNPLIGMDPNYSHYLISVIIAIVSTIVGCFCYQKYSRSVVFRL